LFICSWSALVSDAINHFVTGSSNSASFVELKGIAVLVFNDSTWDFFDKT
jgi:hypothetical protein